MVMKEGVKIPEIFYSFLERNVSDYKGGKIYMVDPSKEEGFFYIEYQNRWYEESNVWVSAYDIKYK